MLGPDGDPSWARPAFLALMVLSGVLSFWNLTLSGWANAFYSAAAQAGSQSWEAFFYGSSDAANSITVDKPPASLWAMALSVRVLGLSSFSILLPQVLMGMATLAILYTTVKRYFGAGAGLLAGAVLAVTPVAVLMFRFNNPDALLVLLMTAGAWATMRAVEKGSIRWMAFVGVLLGFGFLTKTFQAFLVVPFFGLAFLLLASTTLRRRIIGSLVALGSMVLAGGWWVAVVELMPASKRPYIGGSQTNSFLELTFGYNGFGRLSGNESGSLGAGGNNSPTGLTRMFTTEMGGQISWLLPSALILLVMGLVLRGRARRTDTRRAAYVVWGGWLLVTLLTFSFMAGIFHAYYTVALAPAIAALVGMGGAEAWDRRDMTIGRVTMAAAGAAASTWGFILLSRTDAYGDWLRVLVLGLGMGCSLMILASAWLHEKTLPLMVAGTVVAGLAGPTAYSLTTVQSGHTGSLVTAGPSTGGMGGMGGRPGGGGQGGPGGTRGQGTGTAQGAQAGQNTQGNQNTQGSQAANGTTQGGPASQSTQGTQSQTTQGDGGTMAGAPGGGMGGGVGSLLDATTPNTQVITALSSNASSYTWVAAAVGSQSAAGLQLGTGHAVMALGGFNGTDPSPTLAQFQAYAKSGKIHYVLASSGMSGMSGQSGTTTTASQILTWVKAHYKLVTIGGTSFYDLTQPLS